MSENSPIGFDKEELETLLRSVDVLDEHELLEIEKMLEELDRRAVLQAAKDDLIAFCKRSMRSMIWSGVPIGWVFDGLNITRLRPRKAVAHAA